MKLTELETQTTTRLRRSAPPDAEAPPDVEVDSIRIARLPPSRSASGEPAAIAKPPALAFVTDKPRYVNARAAFLLIVVVMSAVFVLALTATGPSGSSHGSSRKAPPRLTPAEQPVAAAASARAAAIARARRDRGTDAELQDTIPAAAPPTPAATP